MRTIFLWRIKRSINPDKSICFSGVNFSSVSYAREEKRDQEIILYFKKLCSGGRSQKDSLWPIITQPTVEQQLQRFWDIESMDRPPRSQEERACEQHFVNNSTRHTSGKFIVRLSTKQNPTALGTSRQLARFLLLEKRLSGDHKLRQQYQDFVTEYLAMGHIQSEADHVNTTHATCRIILFSKPPTPLQRCVLYMKLRKKPLMAWRWMTSYTLDLLNNKISTLSYFSFRTLHVCFTVDIAKIYRQVMMNSEDCDL
jgi:hypothetical protein